MSLHPSPRSRRAFKPCLEALEERTVPACSVFVAGNTLFILGDATAHTIFVNDNGGNGTTASPPGATGAAAFSPAPTQISVTCDGMTQTFQNPASGSSLNITSVVIDTGAGNSRAKNDVVFYLFSQGLQGGAQRTINTTLGGRLGTFEMLFGTTATTAGGTTTVTGGIANSASLTVAVNGANRNGIYREGVDAINDFGIGAASSAFFNLQGGAGDDTIAVNLSGFLDRTAGLTVLATGNAGNDRAFENLNVRGGRTVALVNGGVGDDVVGLFAVFDNSTQPEVPPTFQNPADVTAILNGGGGHDVGYLTPNVQAIGLQQLVVI